MPLSGFCAFSFTLFSVYLFVLSYSGFAVVVVVVFCMFLVRVRKKGYEFEWVERSWEELGEEKTRS